MGTAASTGRHRFCEARGVTAPGGAHLAGRRRRWVPAVLRGRGTPGGKVGRDLARGAERSDALQAWLVEPAAVLIAVLVVLFLAYVTVDQGFRCAYLLVVPIFGGFFGVSVAVLSWFFRRQFRDR